MVDELAPAGVVTGFLASRLATAMRLTERADRLEAQAFAAEAEPVPSAPGHGPSVRAVRRLISRAGCAR